MKRITTALLALGMVVGTVAPAQAAWWDFAVRERGAICGFDRTQKVGLSFYSHEVERWTYTYTSSKPFCRESGERLINQEPFPWVGQPGTLVR